MLLWNVVPTHPHKPGVPSSNRRPTTAEVREAMRFLLELAAGRRTIAVGRLAHSALGGRYVRHPSHGGSAAFRAGLLLSIHSEMTRILIAAAAVVVAVIGLFLVFRPGDDGGSASSGTTADDDAVDEPDDDPAATSPAASATAAARAGPHHRQSRDSRWVAFAASPSRRIGGWC